MNRTALWKHKPYTVYDSSGPPFPNVLITNLNPSGGSPAWTTTGQTFVQNVTGPQGQPAYTSTDSGLSQHIATPPVSASGKHAGIAAKKGTNGWLGIQNNFLTTVAIFDLTNGVVAVAGAYDSASITALGSGWYWCQVDYAAGNVAPTFKNADTQAHCGFGTSFSSSGTMLSFGYALW